MSGFFECPLFFIVVEALKLILNFGIYQILPKVFGDSQFTINTSLTVLTQHRSFGNFLEWTSMGQNLNTSLNSLY